MPTISIEPSAFAAVQATRTAVRTTSSSPSDFASLIDDAQDTVANTVSQDAQTRQRAVDPTGTPRSDTSQTAASDRANRQNAPRDRSDRDDTASPSDDPAEDSATADATDPGSRPVADPRRPPGSGTGPGDQGSAEGETDGDVATIEDPAAAAAAALQAATPQPVATVVPVATLDGTAAEAPPAEAVVAAAAEAGGKPAGAAGRTALPVDVPVDLPVDVPIEAATAADGKPTNPVTDSGAVAETDGSTDTTATAAATQPGTAHAKDATSADGTAAENPAAEITAPEATDTAKPAAKHTTAEKTGAEAQSETRPKGHETRTETSGAQPAAAAQQAGAATAAHVQGMLRAEGLTIIGTAPAGATQVTTGRGEASAPVPLAGVPVEITAQAKSGKHTFDIRLDPPDLGRIHVQLDVDANGTVVPRITADRAETLDLLRRDAGQLERALQDAGLKADQGAMQFSLRDQGSGQYQSDDGPGGRTAGRDDYETGPETGVVELRATYGRLLGRNTGVDIRV